VRKVTRKAECSALHLTSAVTEARSIRHKGPRMGVPAVFDDCFVACWKQTA